MTNQHESKRSPIVFWLWATSSIICVTLIFSGLIWRYAITPGPLETDEKIVNIPPHSSFQQIQKILVHASAINDDLRFTILARYIDAAKHLQAGEYRFAAHITPYNLLQQLRYGKTISRTLMIAEGSNIFQVAQIIEKSGLANEKTILALCHDPKFIKALGLNTASLEGYLFPDTYFFKKATKPHAILTIMVRHYQDVYDQECRDRPMDKTLEIECNTNTHSNDPPTIPINSAPKQKRPLILNARQALILASMIEKETGIPAERPIIAQVFINRLNKKMRLQSDPTVIYGLQKFGIPLTRSDLKTPSPYNTYTLPGLPVGPICNPGRAAIAAVMQPTQSNYYYFVAQDKGHHHFSHTIAEHNRAVNRLRKKRTQESD